MRHTVIGTAGHIDHGKSSLIFSLTGYDPDRLKEEKEREMTTDLGFAFLGENITIIDVPGHEKFIKNMLSGVSTLDMALFVVAADDGVMPQTQEHFEILQMLGVKNGIIVLTKIDMVEDDWIGLVEDEIRELTAGSFLQDAPIFRVSNQTGEGIAELKQAILQMAESLPPRPNRGIFRLWIDRVFSIKGAGTIVAGTVLSGEIKPGDKVELLPKGKIIRVKKVQVHNKPREKAFTGERVAINLMNIEVEEIKRGDALAAPGYFQPTYMFNARFQLLASSKPLKNRSRVRLHLGSAEILCRIVNLEKQDFYPGSESIVQLRLEEKTALDTGDSFVIRNYSPGRTIGGGVVLETHPKKLKYLTKDKIEQLEEISDADPLKMLEYFLKENPLKFHTLDSLAKERAVAVDEMQAMLTKLSNKNVIQKISKAPSCAYMHQGELNHIRETLKRFLREYHLENPMRKGIKKSELKNKLFRKADDPLLDAILEYMKSSGEINIEREKVFISGHTVEFSPQQEKLKQRIAKIYYDAAFITPEFDELMEMLKDEKPENVREVVTGMVETGLLIEMGIKLGKSLIFHADRIEEARKMVIKTIKEKGEAKFYQLRENLKSTRKFTTPILNYFDEQGLTKRIGDIRVLR